MTARVESIAALLRANRHASRRIHYRPCRSGDGRHGSSLRCVFAETRAPREVHDRRGTDT